MRDLGDARLAFIGKRRYVHSTSIFARFIELEGAKTLALDSFKFARETDRNGRFVLFDRGEMRPPDLAAAAASFNYLSSGMASRLEFIDDGPLVKNSEAETAIQYGHEDHAGDYTGRFAFRATDAAHFFRALVEANKRVHALTLRRQGHAMPEFRFAYVEALQFALWPETEGLTISHLGLRSGQGRNFSLNRIDFGKGVPACRICFSWETPS